MLHTIVRKEHNGRTDGVRIRVALLAKGAKPMNIVFEILNAYAAVATIASFLRDLWTDYMKCGRSREGTGEKLK